MVALSGFLEAVEVGLEFLFRAPGGAVDPLQLLIAGIAAPIGAGHLHQLKRLAELAGGRQVGAGAEVEPIALAIDRDVGVVGQGLDVLGLVVLAVGLEVGDGGVAVPDLAADRLVAADDFPHARLDTFEVVGGERLVAGEVVVKTVLDGRAEGDLGLGVKLLHRLGQNMGGVMAQQLEDLVGRRVVAGDDLQREVARDRRQQVDETAVVARGEGGLGEAVTDIGGDVGGRGAGGVSSPAAVGQGNLNLARWVGIRHRSGLGQGAGKNAISAGGLPQAQFGRNLGHRQVGHGIAAQGCDVVADGGAQGGVGSAGKQHAGRRADGSGNVHGPGVVADGGDGAARYRGQLQQVGAADEVDGGGTFGADGGGGRGVGGGADEDRRRATVRDHVGEADKPVGRPAFVEAVGGATHGEDYVVGGQPKGSDVRDGPIEIGTGDLGDAGGGELTGEAVQGVQPVAIGVSVGVGAAAGDARPIGLGAA